MYVLRNFSETRVGNTLSYLHHYCKQVGLKRHIALELKKSATQNVCKSPILLNFFFKAKVVPHIFIIFSNTYMSLTSISTFFSISVYNKRCRLGHELARNDWKCSNYVSTWWNGDDVLIIQYRWLHTRSNCLEKFAKYWWLFF